MLTALKLGNFKAFADTQTIPIKPLTLIFGANSSGKSSIIHGLLLACHANETGNLDVHQTRLGGESVDLGGFRQYIHRHQIQSVVTWGMEIEINGDNRFKGLSKLCYIILYRLNEQSEIVINDINVEADGEQICSFRQHSEGSFSIDRINTSHALFSQFIRPVVFEDSEAVFANTEELLRFMDQAISELTLEFALSLNRVFHLYPTENVHDYLGALGHVFREYIYPEFDERVKSQGASKRQELLRSVLCERICLTLLSSIDVLSKNIRICLQHVHYLAPFRLYPPRHIAFSDGSNPNGFTGGEQEWETVRLNSEVRQAINQWLGSERLQTPYEMSVRRYIAEDCATAVIEELVLRDKRFDTVVSHRDVGFGISQVLPVLVTAYASSGQIVAIEQPEIHLHPKLQAELGDVFIESALGERRNTFLLETHSEHLILRIMRRMRDTARGTLPEGMPPVRPEDVAILYVQPKADNSTSVVSVLELDEEGQLLDPWPGGFFEEGFHERFA